MCPKHQLLITATKLLEYEAQSKQLFPIFLGFPLVPIIQLYLEKLPHAYAWLQQPFSGVGTGGGGPTKGVG